MSRFEKRGHFAPVIFERTPVFKCLVFGQTLLKLDEILVYNNYLIVLLAVYQIFKTMVPNLDEWQQVETCMRSKITGAK